MGIIFLTFWSVFIIIFLIFILTKRKSTTKTQIGQFQISFILIVSKHLLQKIYKNIMGNQIQIFIQLQKIQYLMQQIQVYFNCFYKPSGTYGLFAGQEISVALAKMALDKQYFGLYGKEPLTQQETEVLDSWFQKLCAKYKIIGRIQEEKKDQ